MLPVGQAGRATYFHQQFVTISSVILVSNRSLLKYPSCLAAYFLAITEFIVGGTIAEKVKDCGSRLVRQLIQTPSYHLYPWGGNLPPH